MQRVPLTWARVTGSHLRWLVTHHIIPHKQFLLEDLRRDWPSRPRLRDWSWLLLWNILMRSLFRVLILSGFNSVGSSLYVHWSLCRVIPWRCIRSSPLKTNRWSLAFMPTNDLCNVLSIRLRQNIVTLLVLHSIRTKHLCLFLTGCLLFQLSMRWNWTAPIQRILAGRVFPNLLNIARCWFWDNRFLSFLVSSLWSWNRCLSVAESWGISSFITVSFIAFISFCFVFLRCFH